MWWCVVVWHGRLSEDQKGQGSDWSSVWRTSSQDGYKKEEQVPTWDLLLKPVKRWEGKRAVGERRGVE